MVAIRGVFIINFPWVHTVDFGKHSTLSKREGGGGRKINI